MVSGTIQFDPYCSSKDIIEISTEAYIFFGVQMSIKKLHLGHYGLTHIILPKILYKFPPKTHIFFGVQEFIQKIVSGAIWFDQYWPFNDII